MIEFEILGQPIQWQGLKPAEIGIRLAFLTDALKAEEEHYTAHDVLDGPVCVKLTFYMERPADHYESRRNAPKSMLKGRCPKLHTDMPKANDLAKFVLVALDGVFWQQKDICDLQIKKQYSSNPRTEIVIVEAEV